MLRLLHRDEWLQNTFIESLVLLKDHNKTHVLLTVYAVLDVGMMSVISSSSRNTLSMYK